MVIRGSLCLRRVEGGQGISVALFRLMSNLRGPIEEKRLLYARVITSVFTYAAPIWSNALSSALSKILRPIIRLQRSVAIRVVAAYRTLSFDVAALLARMPPWTLEASMRRRVCARVFDLRVRNEWSKESVMEIKRQERAIMARQWVTLLNRPGAPGAITREAVLPCLAEWIGRRFSNMSFHFTQLVTGHGCFGHYLHRMRKRATSDCLHCHCDDDTAEHTIFICPAWIEERTQLLNKLELEQMDLKTIIRTILQSQEKWFAFSLFASSVMKKKEIREREWEGEISARSCAPPSPT